jgi:flagellar protein FlgJ
MDNEGSDMGTELLDEQWAVKMSGLPGGLSEMIERQLQQQIDPAARRGAAASAATAPTAVSGSAAANATPTQAAFVARHRDVALQVQRETGIPAAFMIGQAAHETGWGRSEIRAADGSNSHNLFGIKATAGWQGKVAEVLTTEYVDGQPRKVVQRFRAYDSYAEAFRDYARLITQSPRYQAAARSVHSVQAYAQQLQQAGYATDPQYAVKLSRVINTTLQLQRALG